MTDEIDVLKKAIAEHEQALRLKNLNQELHSHLSGSIYWLLKYTEKYDIPLPKKDELVRMLEKSDAMIDTIISTAKQQVGQINFHQPKVTPTRSTDNETES